MKTTLKWHANCFYRHVINKIQHSEADIWSHWHSDVHFRCPQPPASSIWNAHLRVNNFHMYGLFMMYFQYKSPGARPLFVLICKTKKNKFAPPVQLDNLYSCAPRFDIFWIRAWVWWINCALIYMYASRLQWAICLAAHILFYGISLGTVGFENNVSWNGFVERDVLSYDFKYFARIAFTSNTAHTCMAASWVVPSISSNGGIAHGDSGRGFPPPLSG